MSKRRESFAVDRPLSLQSVLHAVPVALGLHVETFNLVLTLILVALEAILMVVEHRIAEVIQGKVLDLVVVPIRELDVSRLHYVIELVQVASCCDLNSIANEVAVKLHEEAAKRNVVWWHISIKTIDV